MRSVLSSALAALSWAAQLVTASGATVYVSGDDASVGPRALSPVIARCVLAQRAGVLDYHSSSLDGADGDEVISAINALGVHTPLAEDGKRRRAMILLESSAAEVSSLQGQPSFELDQDPSTDDLRRLFADLAKQADSSLAQVTQHDAIRTLTTAPKKTKTGDFFYLAKDADAYVKLVERLAADKVHVTTIVSSAVSGSDSFDWGRYDMPDKRHDGVTLVRRSADLLSRQDTTYNGTLRGILPACFPSQSACESVTQNCTGHGVCARKFTDETASPSKSCYSCMCRAVTSTNEQGQKKTTYWAGPACQKRDISSSFWLIALFTIGMIFVIGFAIGQIWSMGEEELPSVIGAGVSGPVRRS